MKDPNDIDFTTLNWVKQELDDTLKQARQALEAYVEDTSDKSQMKFCASYLHQVQGTLRMVELYGAAMVVEEMEHVCLALVDGTIKQNDETFEALMRGLVQLPDYLGRLQGGHRDIPIVLLPLLNDLRASRSEKLLSETALFSPNLDTVLPASAGGAASSIPSATLRPLVVKLRLAFQFGLLKWFKGDDVDGNLSRLIAILDRLRSLSVQPDARRLWWIASGVMEGILLKALDSSIAIKLLYGKVDRDIKRLIDAGESDFAAKPPADLTKSLLYYAAHSQNKGQRLAEIKQLYRLDSLLPTQSEIEHANSAMSGRNRALLDTVGAAIKEDVMRVKDGLDMFLRGPQSNVNDLATQGETLQRVADTLGVLGLGIPRKVVIEQRDIVTSIVVGKVKPEEQILLDVAGALLYVESSLDDFIERLGQATQDDAPNALKGLELPQAEVRRILDATMKEATVNLQQAKHDIVAFIESPWDHSKIEGIPKLLEEISGALRMLSMAEPAELNEGITRFVEVELLRHKRVPTAEQLDLMADALASIEYYLEAIREARPNRDRILEVTRRSLEALGYWPLPDPNGLGVAGSDDDAPSSTEFVSFPDHFTTDRTEIANTTVEALAASVDAEPMPSIEVAITEQEVEDATEESKEVDLGGLFVTGDLPIFEEAPLQPLFEPSTQGEPSLFSSEPLFLEETVLPELAEPAVFESEVNDFTFAELDAPDPAPLRASAGADNSAGTLDIENLLGLDAASEPSVETEFAFLTESSEPITFEPGLFEQESLPAELVDVPALVDTQSDFEIHSAVELARPELVEPEPAVFVELAPAVEPEPPPVYMEVATPEPVLEPAPAIVSAVLESVPAPPVEVQAQAEPVAYKPTANEVIAAAGFQMVPSDDIDDEIREVFIEEVDDELKGLAKHFPAWKADQNDFEKLKPVRRSFHTLKGSGRLVGALAIGEFSWKIENMLNRLLDKSIPVSPAVIACLDESIAALPQLLAGLKGEGNPTANIGGLMHVADRVSAGEEIFLPKNEPAPLASFASVDANSTQTVAGVHQDAVAEVAAAESTESALAPADAVVVMPALVAIPATAVLSLPAANTAELSSTDLPEALAMDPLLVEILKSESAAHVATMRAYLREVEKSGVPLPVSEELLRAVHTLNGAISMVDLPLVTNVVGPLEGFLKRVKGKGVPIDARGIEAIGATAVMVEAVMHGIDRGTLKGIHTESLAEVVVALRDGLPEPEHGHLYADLLGYDEDELDQDAGATSIARVEPEVAPATPETRPWYEAENADEFEDDGLIQRFDVVDVAAAERSSEATRAPSQLASASESVVAELARLEQEAFAALPLEDSEADPAVDLSELGFETTSSEVVDLEFLDVSEIDPQVASAARADADDAAISAPDARLEPMLDEAAFSETPQAVAVDEAFDNDLWFGSAGLASSTTAAATTEAKVSDADTALTAEARDATPAALIPQDGPSKSGEVTAEMLDVGASESAAAKLEPTLLDATDLDFLDLEIADDVATFGGETDVASTVEFAAADRSIETADADVLEVQQEAERLDDLVVDLGFLDVPELAEGSELFAPEGAEAALSPEFVAEAFPFDDLFITPDVEPEALALIEPASSTADQSPKLVVVPLDEEALFASDEFATVDFQDQVADGNDPAVDAFVDLGFLDPVEDGALGEGAEVSAQVDLAFLNDDASLAAFPPESTADPRSSVGVEIVEIQSFDEEAVDSEAFADLAFLDAEDNDLGSPAAPPQPEVGGSEYGALEIPVSASEEAETVADAATENVDETASDIGLFAEDVASESHAAGTSGFEADLELAEWITATPRDEPPQTESQAAGASENVELASVHSDSNLPSAPSVAITDELLNDPNDYGTADALEGFTPATAQITPIALDLDPSGPLVIQDADEELLEIFVQEGTDILDTADNMMARLRESPDNREIVIGLQRELHTLKGGARMAGVGPVGDLSHALESLFEAVVDGRARSSKAVMEALERSFDRMHQMVLRVGKRQAIGMPEHTIARLEALAEGREDEFIDAQLATDPVAALPEKRIPEPLAPLAAAANEPAVTADPPVAALKIEAPKRLTALDEDQGAQRQQQESVRVRADLIDNLVNYAGEVSIYRSRLEAQIGGFRFNLQEFDQTVLRLRDQLRKLEMETEAQILSRYQREESKKDAGFDPLELDRFSNLQQLSRALAESVSDLVSLQGLMDDIARQSETLLLQQSRVSSELQEGLMRTRMVPFDALVPRLRRIIRQTGSELGKKAALKVEGAQGEMDRTVLERMTAPLEHMLRNALAHGLERPDRRRNLGKAEEGSINIAVSRESTEVVIKVSDDGSGMDRDAIRTKAIERGLLRQEVQLSDRDLFQFILETGFSTAETVSKVAGRGVGMDVVNSEIKQLGGSLQIDSVKGQGSVFTVRLPFTLSVTRAILIRLADTMFAVPLSSVQGIIRMPRKELDRRLAENDLELTYAGEIYQLYDLGELIRQPIAYSSEETQVPLVMTRTGDQRAAVRVSSVIGSKEVVVKSVGPQLSSVPGFFGATIMGDGSVIVILDLAPLVRHGAALRQAPELAAALAIEPMAPVIDVRRQPLVMVVDDSITMRKVTSRVLERNNMEVVTAKDGLDAVEQLQDAIPDLILLDIEMPRMDGYELATYIRNDSRLRHIPLIMITSRTGEKHRQRAMEIGVERYLGKPYQETDLLRNVTEALHGRSVAK